MLLTDSINWDALGNPLADMVRHGSRLCVTGRIEAVVC